MSQAPQKWDFYPYRTKSQSLLQNTEIPNIKQGTADGCKQMGGVWENNETVLACSTGSGLNTSTTNPLLRLGFYSILPSFLSPCFPPSHFLIHAEGGF